LTEPTTIQIGHAKESEASLYLQAQGLKLVLANYSCKYGEIDLIMQDKEELVFVEVRYRQSDDYGDGSDSVTQEKQRRVIRAAKFYLCERDLYDRIACRFDVVASGPREMLWIKDAFWLKR